MTRQRWFCCLCGNLTKREPRPDGRALCSAHMTVALDAVPPDPLESLPVMSDVWEFCTLDGITVATFDGDAGAMMAACDATADVLGVPLAARKRDDLPPASGTDG